MSGDSGDSSSDQSEKPSCSKRITRRSKNAATTTSCSTSSNAIGSGIKKKRRIVMRIEFGGDSDDISTTSGSSSSLSEADDDGIGGGGGGRVNKRKADKKSHLKNNFIDDDDDIKPCSSRKLRGKLGKKANFVFSSDDINNSSEDDMPGSTARRNNRHQFNNKNRLRNRQRLEDNNDDDDDDEHFDEENNANGGERGSINGREIARTVKSRKRTVISDDEDDNANVASSAVQENNREDENGFNSDSSSNELLEKCPICLLTFRAQEIGSPATCEHLFCANCIEAWSKNVQTCPIDRIEFDRIVVRESYENREILREINVSKTNGAEKLNHDLSDEDVTHCEVCNRPDREDVMLLCDSCNQGYHIDCLNPPLTDVPEGSWYCDNCFDSENSEDSDMIDDLNVLYEDIRDMGIPESRYRVTEVHQPRILRTRQNERIRAAILSRTRSSARIQVTGADAPSTSDRAASSSRTNRAVRNSSRTTKTPKTRRRRKRRARQRTYVVEYDLNNFDEKFAIKTTKRVIRRRRRRRRTRAAVPRCRQVDNSGERMTASKRLAEQLGVKSTDREVRAAASSQSFSLFGNANDLEYFSDSDGGLQSEIQIETGGSGSTAVQTSVRISNFRTHRSKKGLLSRLEREPPSSTPDLLSNIMELQDRWHNASRHLDAVRIGQDGSLNLPSSSDVTTNTLPAEPNSTNTQPANGVNQNDVTEAPMYPRGGGGNNRNFNSGGGGGGGNNNAGGSGNYNNRYNSSQSNYRGGSGSGSSGGGQYRNSFGSSSTSGTGNLFSMVGRGNFSFSSQTFNQNNDNDNNASNNNSNNRDRFNQRNNNNNRNNRNSLPLPLFNNNQANDNIPLLNSNPPPLQQQSPMQPRSLLSIPTVQPPQFQLPAHQQLQSAPTIPSLSSLPLPPPIGLYSSLPPTTAPPPLFRPPPIMSQPPPIMPIRQPPPVIPPLAAPPAFNSSLFQLTADYGNDDDDDSNCPNFSVYSMESLQVAKSDVKAASATKGETPKEDDENEDLVQLSDDDEMMGTNDEDIPLPPPLEKNNDNSDDTANNDSDLYEPDQPTVESEDDSNGNVDESKAQSDVNVVIAEPQKPTENDVELDNSDNAESSVNATTKESQPKNANTEEEAEAIENATQESDKEDEEASSILEIQLPANKRKAVQSQRKGVLELYDDSDWEELNMEKPTAEDYQLRTPPQEATKSPKGEKENDKSDDEIEVEEKDNDEEEKEENNDPKDDEKTDKSDENCTRSPGSIETEINVEDVAEDDDANDKEQDRSYTPCLDEKNDNIDEDDNDGTCTPELTGALALMSGLDGAKNADESGSTTAVDAAGIAGMETELISEDDDAEKRDKKKRNKGEKDKEQFKKISKNQKDRNYRTERASAEKLRNRRGRSRSRTNDKENHVFSHRRAQRGRFKRRELPRYNVRNVVNQRNFKDRYGRDTSRPRSVSRPRRRRSFSRSMSKSRSRSRSKSRSPISPSKRPRRSFSMSPSPPNARRHTISPRRRMRSPMNRSPVRRNSRSPLRIRSRSNSPARRINKQKPKRGPGKRSVSPGKRTRSLSRFTPRLSRSRTPPKHKVKRTKDRKKKKAKKRQASPGSQRSRSRLDRRKGSGPPNKRKRHHTPKAKSPMGDQGWSPSPSPPRNYLHDNVSWTPPLMSPAGVSRLRRNEDYNEFSISSKPPKEKKKREKKKKKSEKRRGEIARKEKRRRDAPPNAASKEVFASGNNILVSVSFNKDGNPPQQTTVVTLPPTREEVLANIRGRSNEQPNDQQPKKKKKRDGREKKRKKLDTKPVAIIDLERSPFQVTQEQADIIVLTDSDVGGNDEENLNVSRESANEMMTQMDHHHPREGSSHRTVNSDKTPPLERLESILEESYENAIQQQGPKTPPEPPGGIKFNLINKNKQKISRNALHDEAGLDSDGHQEEDRQEERDSMAQNSNKIGPNTPPESGPCSPDVYDPFDPTKSPSLSPRSPTPPADMSHESVADNDAPSKHSTEDIRTEPRQSGASGTGNTDKNAINPVDLVMALMNSKTNTSQDSAHKSSESQYNSNQAVVNLIDENDKPDESAIANAGITVLSNVILSKSQHIPSISSPPLSKASSHKPQKLTNILCNLPGLGNRHNGGGMDDAINDIESPYSPGSGDYEDLFEPPPDTNGAKRRRNDKRPNKSGEMFENLFGSSSPPPAGASHLRLPTSTARKHKPVYTSATRNKHKTVVKVSKLPGNNNDDHVKVYDDLPNSAVELQVKDKFLRKLNRQERVVEEVKMILKPRFNKKQISKDDYKEIMRRAVPKICHSKSGEINPKKIQNLIEAYVKKFRQKHKKLNIPNTGQVSSAVKCAAYLKKL